MDNSNPILTYIFFAAAVLAVALYSIDVIPETILTTALGVLGFSGIAGLRKFIDSQGWKTYFTAGMGFAGVIAQFLFPEIVTPERLTLWLSIWGIVAYGSITHAISKLKKINGSF